MKKIVRIAIVSALLSALQAYATTPSIYTCPSSQELQKIHDVEYYLGSTSSRDLDRGKIYGYLKIPNESPIMIRSSYYNWNNGLDNLDLSKFNHVQMISKNNIIRCVYMDSSRNVISLGTLASI